MPLPVKKIMNNALNIKKTKNVKIYCDISKCLGCKSCEIACALEHSRSKDIFKAAREKSLPRKRVETQKINGKIISLRCQHCQSAPCVAACMSGALFKDEAGGATLQDSDKCVGCWMCIMSCPFGAIIQDKAKHIALKCDLCPDREDYACVAACPTGALTTGHVPLYR